MVKTQFFRISETWMNGTHDPTLWNVLKETHLFFNFNRCVKDKSKGGEVALFISLSLAPKERTVLNLFDKERFESVWIECKESFDRSCKKTMLINVSYNPSKQLQSKFLEELTKNIANGISKNSSIHLLGDYNIDYLDHIEQNKLDSAIILYGLNVCSAKETKSKSSSSHIDYIITESSNILIDFVFDSHFKSDHLSSLCNTKTVAKKTSPKIVFNFDKTNYNPNEFRQTLSALPWHVLYSSQQSCLLKFSFLINLISLAFSKHAPLKTSFVRNHKFKNLVETEWFDNNCKQALERKQKRFEIFLKDKNEENWKAYTKAKSDLSYLIYEKEETHANTIYNSLSSIKDKWKFMNTTRGSNKNSSNICAIKNSFGDVITNGQAMAIDLAMAEFFNYKFVNPGEYIGKPEKLQNAEQSKPKITFSFHLVDERNMYKFLKELHPKKPTRPCTVPAWAIKDGTAIIVPHLTYVINECIKNNVFPDELKNSKCYPSFYKKMTHLRLQIIDQYR